MPRSAEFPLPEFEKYLSSIGGNYNLLASMRRLWKTFGTDELTLEQVEAHSQELPMSMKATFRSAWRKYAEFVTTTENRRLPHLPNSPRGPAASKEDKSAAPTTYAVLVPELFKHLGAFLRDTTITPPELNGLTLNDCRPSVGRMELHCKSGRVLALTPAVLQAHGYPIMQWAYPNGPPTQPGPIGPVVVPETPFLPAKPVDVTALDYVDNDTGPMPVDTIKAILRASTAAQKAGGASARLAAVPVERIIRVASLDDDNFVEVGCKYALGCGGLAGPSGFCASHSSASV